MKSYALSSGLAAVPSPASEAAVTVLTAAEWPALAAARGLPTLPPGTGQLNFSRAELYSSCIAGCIARPHHSGQAEHQRFLFYITAQNVYFVDDTGGAQRLLEELAARFAGKRLACAPFFAALLHHLVEKDGIFLQGVEEQLARLEETVEKPAPGFNQQLSGVRKLVMRFQRYYEQLTDLAQVLEADEENLFGGDAARTFGPVAARCQRLRDMAFSLREYCIQVHENYQAQLSQQQARSMNTLTAVTTVFMPLSLLTGWFGMNFAHMPGLQSPWGYPLVALAAVLIVLGCFWVLKKRKFF